MAYTRVHADWKDYPDVTTPLTEAKLETIETGIFDAAATADAAVPKAIIDGKGELLVGTANDALDNLAISTNGFVLTLDSAQTLGVKWAAAAAAVSAATATEWIPVDLRNPQSASNGGNSWGGVTTMTDWEMWRWEFLKDVVGKVYGIVHVPKALHGTPAAKIVLVIAANATSGVTRLQVSTKSVANAGSLQPAALVDETAQDITVPATAYLRKDVSFTLTNAPAASDILIVEVHHEGTHANDTLAVNTLLLGAYLEVATSRLLV